MSLDYLQVGRNFTSVRAPDSYITSGLASASSGVLLGKGLLVTESGMVARKGGQVDSEVGASIANAATITPNFGVIRVSVAAETYGVKLAVGTYPNQELVIINEGAKFWFAALGTSYVASGITTAVLASSHTKLIWDAKTSLWYLNT
jgi:hypothetical protein